MKNIARGLLTFAVLMVLDGGAHWLRGVGFMTDYCPNFFAGCIGYILVILEGVDQ